MKTDGFENLAKPCFRLLKIGFISASHFFKFDMHILKFCSNDKVPWVIEHQFPSAVNMLTTRCDGQLEQRPEPFLEIWIQMHQLGLNWGCFSMFLSGQCLDMACPSSPALFHLCPHFLQEIAGVAFSFVYNLNLIAPNSVLPFIPHDTHSLTGWYSLSSSTLGQTETICLEYPVQMIEQSTICRHFDGSLG